MQASPYTTKQEEVAIAVSQDNSRATETGQKYRESEALVSTDLPRRENNGGNRRGC